MTLNRYFNPTIDIVKNDVAAIDGKDLHEYLCILDTLIMFVMFANAEKNENKHDLDLIINYHFSCAIVESDNHFIFALRQKAPAQQFMIRHGHCLNDLHLTNDKIAKTLTTNIEFEPNTYLWLNKNIWENNQNQITQLANKQTFLEKTQLLEQPQFQAFTNEIKHSAEEYFSLQQINKQLKNK